MMMVQLQLTVMTTSPVTRTALGKPVLPRQGPLLAGRRLAPSAARRLQPLWARKGENTAGSPTLSRLQLSRGPVWFHPHLDTGYFK